MVKADDIEMGDRVLLDDEEGCIVPGGEYTVSKKNDDGSFHVGGRTAVWPRRVITVYRKIAERE